jgi:hypothetical protein
MSHRGVHERRAVARDRQPEVDRHVLPLEDRAARVAVLAHRGGACAADERAAARVDDADPVVGGAQLVHPEHREIAIDVFREGAADQELRGEQLVEAQARGSQSRLLAVDRRIVSRPPGPPQALDPPTRDCDGFWRDNLRLRSGEQRSRSPSARENRAIDGQGQCFGTAMPRMAPGCDGSQRAELRVSHGLEPATAWTQNQELSQAD